MIPRYSLPEMAEIWSEQHKVDTWKSVEALALEGWATEGVVPQSAAKAVTAAPEVDLAAWKRANRRRVTTSRRLWTCWLVRWPKAPNGCTMA